MKSKHILLGYLLFTMFTYGLMINVNATIYEIKLNTGYEFIYEVTEVNEEVYEIAYGSGWKEKIGARGNEGARQKLVITSIENKPEYWEINYNIWVWTTEEFSETPDGSASTQLHKIILKDDTYSIDWFVPTPVDDYLKERYLDDPSEEIHYTPIDSVSVGHRDEGKFAYQWFYDEDTGAIESEYIYYSYSYPGGSNSPQIWAMELQPSFLRPPLSSFLIVIILVIAAISVICIYIIIRKIKA